jgi:hypothetical protein
MPIDVLRWFVLRSSVEVIFRGSSSPRSREQRQWSDLAIARTAPTVLGVLSLIVLDRVRSTLDHFWDLARSDLGSHKGEADREAIGELGAQLLFLRP